MKKIFCYQHHITKYDDDTAGMSLMQHGAYRRLIDAYYRTGGKLPAKMSQLNTIVSAQNRAERDAVAYAVAQFFTVGDDGFLRQNGCEKELFRITKVSEDNRRKANIKHLKDKERRSAAAQPVHMPEACREPANYKLRTKVEEYKEYSSTPLPPNGDVLFPDKITKPKTPEPEGFDNFWKLYPKQRAGARDKAMAAYAKAIKRTSVAEILAATESYALSDAVARGYAKNAAGWLNDDRWTDANVPQAPPAQQQRKRTYSDELQDAANMAISRLERQSNEIY